MDENRQEKTVCLKKQQNYWPDNLRTVDGISGLCLFFGYFINQMFYGNRHIIARAMSFYIAFLVCHYIGIHVVRKIYSAVNDDIKNQKKGYSIIGIKHGIVFGVLIGGIIGTVIAPVAFIKIFSLNFDVVWENLSFCTFVGTGPGMLIGLIIGIFVGPILAKQEAIRLSGSRE
ncbi:MAG: hypothetical protein PHW04_06500 [Candidatus Wallbacteria bacterium]|nr:hypothetical protein [Candidatus Wallbacteria bacterium]